MAAVETKVSGYFTERLKNDEDDKDGFGTNNLTLKPEELSYALGKKGMTRKKLARSSGCIVECVPSAARAARDRAPPHACRLLLAAPSPPSPPVGHPCCLAPLARRHHGPARLWCGVCSVCEVAMAPPPPLASCPLYPGTSATRSSCRAVSRSAAVPRNTSIGSSNSCAARSTSITGRCTPHPPPDPDPAAPARIAALASQRSHHRVRIAAPARSARIAAPARSARSQRPLAAPARSPLAPRSRSPPTLAGAR